MSKSLKEERLGATGYNKQGCLMKVVEYNGADEEDKLLPHIRIFETEEYQCGERKWIKYMYREDRIKAEQERKKKLREETKADPQLSWMLDFE